MSCFQLCLMVVTSFFLLDISFAVNSDPSQRSLKELHYNLSKDFQPTEVFGQVTAVAYSANGNIFIFHRGNVRWDSGSFDANNEYRQNHSPPINVDTIVELHPSTGQVINKWGSNMFYMPHGLTIDSTGCFWLTDVALHQVFKFIPGNTKNASIVLGVRFQPGSDAKHFCKPTSVAVHSKSKDFYVADGYCNSRVVKFNSKGEYMAEYKMQGPPQLNIPHKIVMIEEITSACLADRQNKRIVCFDVNDANSMQPMAMADGTIFNNPVYSIAYAPCSTGMIFAVDEAGYLPASVFVISLKDRTLVHQFGREFWREGLRLHDVAVSSDCSQVFTVDIDLNRIWKFETNFFPHDKAAIAAAEVRSTSTSESTSEESFWSRSSIISMLSLVVIVAVIAVRSIRQPLGAKLSSLRSRFCSRSDTFDLSRLLEDPEKSGFNRVSTTETDMDVDLSDSEVEEFNVSSIRNNHRVAT